jgi:hypothetical protein
MGHVFIDIEEIPTGVELVWMDGLIVAAFEVVEAGIARRSIEKTCENKGWYFLDGESLIGFDPNTNESHEFKIIWVLELPPFDRLPVYFNHVSDVLF